MLVIGITGLKTAGKSTVARRLIEKHGFQQAKFSAALKEMLRAFLRYRGVSDQVIERMIEGELKEVISPYLNGKSPREAMVTLGTEWGRDLIHKNLWVDTEREAILTRSVGKCPKIVFEDVRFDNEVDTIRRLCGSIWHVTRLGLRPDPNAHESERLEVEADVDIRNIPGEWADLWAQIDGMVDHEHAKRGLQP